VFSSFLKTFYPNVMCLADWAKFIGLPSLVNCISPPAIGQPGLDVI